MNEVAPDWELAMLMWLCALKAKNDPRYIPAMLAVAERKWGRVKFEMEHEGTGQVIVTVGCLDIPYLPKPCMREIEGQVLPVIASGPGPLDGDSES